MSWSAHFDVPVKLPSGKTLATLDDARRYLVTITDDKSNRQLQIALEALLMAAENRSPVIHANVGVAQFVYGPAPIPKSRPSKEKSWGRRKLKRDI